MINKDLIVKWNQLIRSGNGLDVKVKISRLNLKKIERTWAVEIANLARRTGLSQIGIKVLFPYVRGAQSQVVTASSSELAEYGSCLAGIGSLEEAEKLLKVAISRGNVDANLALAMVYFQSWRYEESLPFLEQFLSKTKDKYKFLVGQLNLIAAKVATGGLSHARKKIVKLLQSPAIEDEKLLYGSLYELLAQVEFQNFNLKLSSLYIDRSVNILSKTSNAALLYAKKWQAVINGHLENNKFVFKKNIEVIKKEAEKLQIWETIRECDFYDSLIRNDRLLFQKVYFGSPHKCYRQMILRKSNMSAGNDYCLNRDFDMNVRAKNVFIGQSVFCFNDKVLKLGFTPHKLLRILLSDFYSPFSTGSLFSKLYPDELYDPNNSPDRVYKSIRRLKDFLCSEDLPIAIDTKNSRYHLHPQIDCSILLINPELTGEKGLCEKLSLLLDSVGTKEFTAKDAGQVLKVSKRSVNRVIREGITAGKVKRLGMAKNTRYKKVS